MQINCDDWFSYESEIDDLIQEGDILDNKKCSQIRINYRDSKLERRISLELSHGNSNYGNNLTVTGDDKNWVAGTFDSLNDIIDSAKPQEHWFMQYWNLILFLWVAIICYSVTDINQILTENILQVIWGYLILILLSFVILWLLMGWVQKLWLSVEFDFGPEHKKIEKNRRYRIGLFFSIFIIPWVWTLF
jgi:hypothetical protein